MGQKGQGAGRPKQSPPQQTILMGLQGRAGSGLARGEAERPMRGAAPTPRGKEGLLGHRGGAAEGQPTGGRPLPLLRGNGGPKRRWGLSRGRSPEWGRGHAPPGSRGLQWEEPSTGKGLDTGLGETSRTRDVLAWRRGSRGPRTLSSPAAKTDTCSGNGRRARGADGPPDCSSRAEASR